MVQLELPNRSFGFTPEHTIHLNGKTKLVESSLERLDITLQTRSAVISSVKQP
jgi:hypothetical protein